MTALKRIDVGNRIKVDTLGNGNYEVGTITAFDKSTNTVTFKSKCDGQEVRVNRRHAEKCSKREFDEFAAKYEEAPKAAALQGEAEQDPNHGNEPEELGEESEQPEEEPGDETRSVVKRKYRSRYQKSKDAEGVTRVDNGDAVARTLRGKDLETVYTVVAHELGLDSGELEQKYAHLNAGHQRMVLGNRLRALYRKQAEESGEEE